MADKKVTKSFTQKRSNTNPEETYYFGTDGLLVDMLSGLNLQEQLKIGFVPDNIQIIDDGNSFTVIQTYKYNDIIYSVVSTTTQLTDALLTEFELQNNAERNVIMTNNYTDIGLAVQQTSTSSVQEATVVTISLYNGIYDPAASQDPISSKILIIPEVDI